MHTTPDNLVNEELYKNDFDRLVGDHIKLAMAGDTNSRCLVAQMVIYYNVKAESHGFTIDLAWTWLRDLSILGHGFATYLIALSLIGKTDYISRQLSIYLLSLSSKQGFNISDYLDFNLSIEEYVNSF